MHFHNATEIHARVVKRLICHHITCTSDISVCDWNSFSISVFPADEQRERRLKRCKTRWNHVLGLVDLFAQNSKHSGCGIRFQSASGFFGNSCELTISSRTKSVVGNREWYMLDNTSRCICTSCSSLYHFSTSLFAFRMNVMPHSIRETHQSCGCEMRLWHVVSQSETHLSVRLNALLKRPVEKVQSVNWKSFRLLNERIENAWDGN